MKYTKQLDNENNTVLITFTDSDRKPETYRVVKKEDIYDQILNNEKINISKCYLEGFSIKELYEKVKASGDSSKNSIIKSFTAASAFFENISFANATFGDGRVNFSYATFGNGKVNFINITFGNEKVRFLGATFGDEGVYFINTKFGYMGIDFTDAKFGNGEVNFINTKFNGDVYFFNAKFGDGDVYFSDAKFDGRVNFSDATFGDGKVYFSNVDFGYGDIDFDRISIKSDWNFESVQAKRLNFSSSLIHGTISFLGEKTNISQLVLDNTKLTGKLFIRSKELKLSGKLHDSRDAINSQDISYTKKANQFRLLKENFRSLGQYDDEDRAYVQLKRNELLNEKKTIETALKIKKISYKIKILKNPQMPKLHRLFERFWYLSQYSFYALCLCAKRILFQNMGRFGTSPKHVAISMLIMIFMFSIIYFVIFAVDSTIFDCRHSGNWLAGLRDCFIFSVTTFFTLSFNKLQPGHFCTVFLAGLEGGVGLFLMAYFTIAFSRKVLR